MRMYWRGAVIPFDEVTWDAMACDQIYITDEDPENQPTENNMREWGWMPEQAQESIAEIQELLKPSRPARILNVVLRLFGK